jgi:hypothetical protein
LKTSSESSHQFDPLRSGILPIQVFRIFNSGEAAGLEISDLDAMFLKQATKGTSLFLSRFGGPGDITLINEQDILEVPAFEIVYRLLFGYPEWI